MSIKVFFVYQYSSVRFLWLYNILLGCCLTVKIQNVTIIMKNSLEISYLVKHRFTTWPSNLTPRYLPKRNEDLCSNKELSYMQMILVPLVMLHKTYKQPDVLQLVNEWTVKNLTEGILLRNKEETIDSQDSMDESWMYFTNSKKTALKVHVIWSHPHDILEKAKL
jgi:hypothetical protein